MKRYRGNCKLGDGSGTHRNGWFYDADEVDAEILEFTKMILRQSKTIREQDIRIEELKGSEKAWLDTAVFIGEQKDTCIKELEDMLLRGAHIIQLSNILEWQYEAQALLNKGK